MYYFVISGRDKPEKNLSVKYQWSISEVSVKYQQLDITHDLEGIRKRSNGVEWSASREDSIAHLIVLVRRRYGVEMVFNPLFLGLYDFRSTYFRCT